MGWKPAVVVVIVGAIVAVVSMVIETVLVSVTVLWKMSDDSRVMLRGCGTYPVVVTSTGGGVMTFVGVTVRFFWAYRGRVRTLETVATFAVELEPSWVKQRTADTVLIWAFTAEAEATRRRGNAENFMVGCKSSG
jgi:hypothetical protein